MPEADGHSSHQFTPDTVADLQAFVAARTAECPPLILRGGGTDLHIGLPPRPESVSVHTTALNQVVDYPARDMTVTVQAGVTVETLTRVLSENNQQLPVDVRAPDRATVGGIVAANHSGPRRFGYGTLRDYVIGIEAIDGTGRAFKAGGRVVKNVAGYDFCKLLTGSFGSLAAITQLTFKLRPIPAECGMLWSALDSFAAADRILERLVTSAARPVIVDTISGSLAGRVQEQNSDWPRGHVVLLLGVEGNSADEIDWQLQTLENEFRAFEFDDSVRLNREQSQHVLTELMQFTRPSASPLLFRANVRPSVTQSFQELCASSNIITVAHAANGIVYGQLPCETESAKQAATLLEPLKTAAHSSNGDLVVLDCDDHWKASLPVGGQARSQNALSRKLKDAFDPLAIFSRGRLHFPTVRPD